MAGVSMLFGLVGMLVAAAPADAVLVVDAAHVQSVSLVELNVDVPRGQAPCRSAVMNRQLCPHVGRRYTLTHAQRDRALTLVNNRATYAGSPAGACTPHHAFVFETTRGPVAVDVAFACRTVRGPRSGGPTRSVESELIQLFRSSGLVAHLPAPKDRR